MSSNWTPEKESFQPHDIEWNDIKANNLWDFYGASSSKDTFYFGATAGAHVARFIRRRGLLKKAKTILDYSCGKGHLIEQCCKHLKDTTSIIGYDPSERSILKANNRNKLFRSFRGAFQLRSLPSDIESSFADLILLTEVIEHLNENTLDAVLNDCYRILKPEGALFITTPNCENLDREKTICPECGCIFHRWQHVRSWTINSLESTLHQHGFANLTSGTITWGNELIDIAFSLLNRRKTGIYVFAKK